MLASLVSILMLTSNINLSIFADEEPAVSEVVNEGAAQGAEEGGFTEEVAGGEAVEEGGFTEEAGNADDGANLDSSSDDSEFSSESSSKSYEDEESQG